MIYRWSGSEKYAGYIGVTAADERKICWFDPLIGEPLPAQNLWSAAHLTQYLGEKKKRKPRRIGDAPASGMINLISQRAAEALADIWQRDALLYPVELEDCADRYYMVVVKSILDDVLDREASRGKRNTYGGNPNHFVSLDEWVFREDMLTGLDLFRIPDQVGYFVTESFMRRVVDAGLEGFCLRRYFWEEKPFIS